jgi:hypothetical protein
MLLSGCASSPQINSGIFEVHSDSTHVKVAFSDNDRRIIHKYYHIKKSKYKKSPPGLAKKNTLPPGLQKQLQRKGKLPPGLDKRNLPYELEEKLSPLPQGYVRIKVGGNIVLMDEQSEVIFDIIHDIG